jgi:hypothetical protein
VNFSALPELLLSWVKNQGVALLQGDNKTPSATFQAGQQYEGKVLDNLVSGRKLVQVSTQLLDMNLPAKMQPGETVRLTNINAGPRPSFLLNQTPVSATQQVQISNTAQQINTLLRLVQTPAAISPQATTLASTPPAANLAQMSSSQPRSAATVTAGIEKILNETVKPATGMPAQAVSTTATSSVPARPIVANVVMLQNFTAAVQPTTAALTGLNTGLLGQAVDAPRAAVPSSTTLSANTLVELPAAARNMLPVRLSQTISESGVFYESHLAKWSSGSLSLETILREPQARIGQEAHVSVKLAELGGMPEEAARLAGRQLQMLEGAPFLWEGLAWPGQAMEWQVREEAGGEGQGEADEAAAEWVTELKLTLPRMGGVHAQLGLAGDRLRLRLLATESATREALTVSLPLLAKGFEANGLHPVELQVEALHGET